jgi:hypothetical protein
MCSALSANQGPYKATAIPPKQKLLRHSRPCALVAFGLFCICVLGAVAWSLRRTLIWCSMLQRIEFLLAGRATAEPQR